MAGIGPRAAIIHTLAAVLSVAFAAGAIGHRRTGAVWARRVVGLAVLGLAAIAVLCSSSIGLLLLPAIVFDVLAWRAGDPRGGEPGPSGP